ncbi:MAG TPA: hypothetical protein VFR64_03710 [Methylomirabilota bacterium]|nr:hypothetical protein [Methylomirabilota bacterium]
MVSARVGAGRCAGTARAGTGDRYFNQGGLMEHAMVPSSMRLFATEVLPHCR